MARDAQPLAALPANRPVDWFAPARFSLLLALLIVATFPNELLGLGTFFFRDFGYFTAPLAYYHRESFWRGELFPLWNPLSNCGTPFLAQWSTLTLYPGSLIYLLLPFPWGLNLYMLIHLFLAGFGMYRLLEQWTGSRRAAAWGGIAFAFNGMMLNSLMWSNYLASFAWMPWTILCVERAWRQGWRHVPKALAVASLQMLSATPELILFTWLLLAGLFAAQILLPNPKSATGNSPFVFLTIIAGVSLLCAAQLFPFLELLARSQRHTEFGDGTWAMPPWGWANLILPLFHTFAAHHGVHFQPTQFWTSSYYPGIAILALALWAPMLTRSRRVIFLAGAALAALVLALGDAGGLYAALRRVVPLAGFMRFPIKFVMLAAFLLPCLAGFTIARLEHAPPPDQRRFSRQGVLLTCLMIAALALLVAWTYWRPLPDERPPTTALNALARGTFLVFTGIAGLGLLRLRHPSSLPNPPRSSPLRPLWPILPLLLLWADVLTHAPNQNPTAALWVFDSDVQQLEPAPQPGQARLMVSAEAHARLRPASIADPSRDAVFKRQALFDNANLFNAIPKVDGLFSLYLREFDHLRTLLYGDTNVVRPRLMDFLGVSLWTAPGEFISFQQRPTALPWVTFGQTPLEADANTTLAAMARDDWDPARTVFLPLQTRPLPTPSEPAAARPTPGLPAPSVADPPPRSSPNPPAQVRLASFSAHRLEIEVTSPDTGLVVIAQAYYSHWKAEVNGRSVPVLRANHAFQAVSVPAGQSQLTLTYRDRTFVTGLALSAASWAVLLPLVFRQRSKGSSELPPGETCA